MRSQIVRFTLTTNDQIVLPPNPDRVSLRLSIDSMPTTASVLIAFGLSAKPNGFTLAFLGGGNDVLQVYAQMPFTIHDVGEQLKLDFHAYVTSSTCTLCVIEGFI